MTPRTDAHQASLSIEISRQESWSGLPLPSPGDLPDHGIKPGSPALQADSLPIELLGKPFHYHADIFLNLGQVHIKLFLNIPGCKEMLKGQIKFKFVDKIKHGVFHGSA